MNKKLFLPLSLIFGFFVSLCVFFILSFVFPVKENSLFNTSSDKTLYVSMNLSNTKEDTHKKNSSNKKSDNQNYKILSDGSFFESVKTENIKTADPDFLKKDVLQPDEKIDIKNFLHTEIIEKTEKVETRPEAAVKTKSSVSVKNVYEVSDLNKKPYILESEKPVFPLKARRLGIKKGKIVLKFIINSNGEAENISVYATSHPGVFDESAITALKKWRFSPGKLNGQNVKTNIFLPVKYEIQE